jgi:hypothetical protein
MQDLTEIIYRGKSGKAKFYEINQQEFVATGYFIRTLQLKEDWLEDIKNPDVIIEALARSNQGIDIFSFRQRVPDSKPRYSYYFEWINNAAIHVISYEDWFRGALSQNSRNKIRKSLRKGLEIKECEFTDEFIRDVLEIYNEMPIRQGKRYVHYGIDFDKLKKAHSTFLDRALFLGAYYRKELIGFLKIVSAGQFMRTMGILAKTKHRDKAPLNALIAKAVEICAQKGIQYFVYGQFDYGKVGSQSIKDFKRYQGFEGILLPKYYVPITPKGNFVLKMKLHHGIIGLVPKYLIQSMLKIRNLYYEKVQH